MEQVTTRQPHSIPTRRCAIEECPIEISLSRLMCAGHWRMVPRPIQAEIYSVFRKRRGGAAHQAAIARAMQKVREVLDHWARKKAGHPAGDVPGFLPYRDD